MAGSLFFIRFLQTWLLLGYIFIPEANLFRPFTIETMRFPLVTLDSSFPACETTTSGSSLDNSAFVDESVVLVSGLYLMVVTYGEVLELLCVVMLIVCVLWVLHLVWWTKSSVLLYRARLWVYRVHHLRLWWAALQ